MATLTSEPTTAKTAHEILGCSTWRKNSVELREDAQRYKMMMMSEIFETKRLKGNNQEELGAGQPDAGCVTSQRPS